MVCGGVGMVGGGGRHDISQEPRLSVETRLALGKRSQLTMDAELHFSFLFFFPPILLLFTFFRFIYVHY